MTPERDPRLLSADQLAIYLEYDEPKPLHVAQLLEHVDALAEALDEERAALEKMIHWAVDVFADPSAFDLPKVTSLFLAHLDTSDDNEEEVLE
jgi:hypothetical protein